MDYRNRKVGKTSEPSVGVGGGCINGSFEAVRVALSRLVYQLLLAGADIALIPATYLFALQNNMSWQLFIKNSLLTGCLIVLIYERVIEPLLNKYLKSNEG